MIYQTLVFIVVLIIVCIALAIHFDNDAVKGVFGGLAVILGGVGIYFWSNTNVNQSSYQTIPATYTPPVYVSSAQPTQQIQSQPTQQVQSQSKSVSRPSQSIDFQKPEMSTLDMPSMSAMQQSSVPQPKASRVSTKFDGGSKIKHYEESDGIIDHTEEGSKLTSWTSSVDPPPLEATSSIDSTGDYVHDDTFDETEISDDTFDDSSDTSGGGLFTINI